MRAAEAKRTRNNLLSCFEIWTPTGTYPPSHSVNCLRAELPPLSWVRLIQRFFQRVGLDQVAPAIRRTFVAIVGTTILLIGLLLIFLPGPGSVVILIGLAVLGSEFVWARRIVRHARELGRQGQAYMKSLVTKP